MKFETTYVNRLERFSVGIEQEAGRPYLSFPVSNHLVDYEEYYWIDGALFDAFQQNLPHALGFLDACRKRQQDDLLIMPPGSRRGYPS